MLAWLKCQTEPTPTTVMPNVSISVIDRTGTDELVLLLPPKFTANDVIRLVEAGSGYNLTQDNSLWPDIDIETIHNMTIIRCHHDDTWYWTIIYYE